MLAVLLALGAAIGFSASDYFAGLATRAESVFRVTLVAEGASLILTLLITPWVSPFHLTGAAAGWGAVAGVAGDFGALTLYLGFRNAAFSVASTVSAVGSAALSVTAGLLFGERPSGLAVAGIALALPAIAAVSASSSGSGEPAGGHAGRHLAGVGYGLAAGAGFALYFVGLNRAGPGSGLWPVAIGQATALPVVVIGAVVAGQLALPGRRPLILATWTGVTATAGTLFFFVASHKGLLAATAVITSLYPAGTIVLARVLLAERISLLRLIGLCLAGASVALIAVA